MLGLGWFALDRLSRTVWNVMNPPPPRFSADQATSKRRGLFLGEFTPLRGRATLPRYGIDVQVGDLWLETDTAAPDKDAWLHFAVTGNTVGHARRALEPTARLAVYSTKYRQWLWADGHIAQVSKSPPRAQVAVLVSEVFNRDVSGVSDEHLWLRRLPGPGSSARADWYAVLDFTKP